MTQRRSLKILLLNLYFPPDTAATAAVFSDVLDAFVERGHHVTVLTGRPSYDPVERRSWRPLQREVYRGAIVERVGSTALDRRIKGGRAANYLTFVPAAALRGVIRPKPDVVVVGSDPFLAVWAALISAKGRPVVYNLQDLNPDAGVMAGLIKPKATTRLWDHLHRAGMNRCSKIVCLSEGMRERVVAKGIARSKTMVIPNGAWPPTGLPDQIVVSELRRGSEFVVMHAGNLSVTGAWDSIVAAARTLDENSEIVFVGTGYENERLRGSGVRLEPFRPREQVPSVMAAGDLQIVSLKRGVEGMVVPSKIYSILAHGRPILAVAPERSEVARLVNERGCGLVADPDDPRDIAHKINRARADPKALEEMGRRAHEAFKAFNRGDLLHQLVALVEEVSSA